MEVKVLDCTLRDGAYVVNGNFGNNVIRSIISSLSFSGIDIIECGWLKDVVYDKDSVFYNLPSDVEYLLPSKKSEFSLMFDYGKYNVEKLTNNSGIIDIIRIAFYKKNLDEISFVVDSVKTKGYKVFLQPSNIMEYSDREMEKLCMRSNFLGVDSVYIVDSFGSMFPEDLERIVPIFDEIVKTDIPVGFHSHNSIQLSFALSMQYIKLMKNRNILIDSTLCGIGRGAGNTKTELLLEYLNKKSKRFDMDLVKFCINENILPLYKDFDWEYRPEKGYKGIKGLHPNEVLK